MNTNILWIYSVDSTRSTKLLCSPKSTDHHFQFTKRYLKTFAINFCKLYHAKHMIYNANCLIYLADDCFHFKDFFLAHSLSKTFKFNSQKLSLWKNMHSSNLYGEWLYTIIWKILGFLLEIKKQTNSTITDSANPSRRSDSFLSIID